MRNSIGIGKIRWNNFALWTFSLKMLLQRFICRKRRDAEWFFICLPETISDIFQQTRVYTQFFFLNPHFGSLLPRLWLLVPESDFDIVLRLQSLNLDVINTPLSLSTFFPPGGQFLRFNENEIRFQWGHCYYPTTGAIFGSIIQILRIKFV